MNYISLIEESKKRGSVPGLDAIEGLLEELGHPEDNLKIVNLSLIHISEPTRRS